VDASPPLLLVIVGPPAVGKATVGDEVARRTGLKLFHNHHTIDLVLNFFPFGSPPFRRLVGEFRRRVLEEIAASDLPGVVFTYVWAFNDEADAQAVESYSAPFKARGGPVMFVELECAQDERLRRNETELRRRRKSFIAPKQQLLELDTQYRLNSRGALDDREDYVRIDNTNVSAADVAERIIETFSLPRVDQGIPG